LIAIFSWGSWPWMGTDFRYNQATVAFVHKYPIFF
jgi:hypothetical protein